MTRQKYFMMMVTIKPLPLCRKVSRSTLSVFAIAESTEHENYGDGNGIGDWRSGNQGKMALEVEIEIIRWIGMEMEMGSEMEMEIEIEDQDRDGYG